MNWTILLLTSISFALTSLIGCTNRSEKEILEAEMLALRLESPIQIPLHLDDDDLKEQNRTLRKLLLRLRQNLQGLDVTDGTSYRCTRSQDLRLLQIKASRAAWRSSWTAEVRVISSDQWHNMEGQVHLICLYLYGPKKKVSNQEGDAIDAAARINNRLNQVLSDLVATSEFKDRISL